MGGIHIKDKDVMDMIKKVSDLKQNDEALYEKKVDELKNTIGQDKVEKKLKELDMVPMLDHQYAQKNGF